MTTDPTRCHRRTIYGAAVCDGRPLTIDGGRVHRCDFRHRYTDHLGSAMVSATSAEIAGGMVFYPVASVAAAEIAAMAGRDGDVRYGADIVAILSPGCDYDHNVDVARDVGVGVDIADITYQGYGSNLSRAVEYRRTADRRLVRGPKVSPFADTIADPLSPDVTPVIDRHMMSGVFHNPKSLENVGVRDVMCDAVCDVAAMFGVLPSQLQAITWSVFRRPYIARRRTDRQLAAMVTPY